MVDVNVLEFSQRRVQHCHLKNYCFEAKKRSSSVNVCLAAFSGFIQFYWLGESCYFVDSHCVICLSWFMWLLRTCNSLVFNLLRNSDYYCALYRWCVILHCQLLKLMLLMILCQWNDVCGNWYSKAGKMNLKKKWFPVLHSQLSVLHFLHFVSDYWRDCSKLYKILQSWK